MQQNAGQQGWSNFQGSHIFIKNKNLFKLLATFEYSTAGLDLTLFPAVKMEKN
jgi:hypothetical protein